MPILPIYNATNFFGSLPIRVSSQATRDRDHSHFHQHIQLCFVLSGELKHKINGTEYIQRAGSCAFILPYMSHTLDSKNSDDTPIIAYVWFEESFLTERGYDFYAYGKNTAHFEGRLIPAISDFPQFQDDAMRTIRNIMEEFNLQKNMSYDKLAAYIAELMRLACVEPARKISSLSLRQVDRINLAVSHIIRNYAQKINTDDLCEIANMSRRSFTEHFKSTTGLTVSEFILSVRIFNASKLLFEEDILYDEAAKKCGLYNQSNLARVFTKHLGMSPTQYVKQHNINTSILHQIPIRHRFNWLLEE